MNLYIKCPGGLAKWETAETDQKIAIEALRSHLHDHKSRILALITEWPEHPDKHVSTTPEEAA